MHCSAKVRIKGTGLNAWVLCQAGWKGRGEPGCRSRGLSLGVAILAGPPIYELLRPLGPASVKSRMFLIARNKSMAGGELVVKTARKSFHKLSMIL